MQTLQTLPAAVGLTYTSRPSSLPGSGCSRSQSSETVTMTDQTRSLLSQKSSDSGLHIQLHPLVLLSISDHITRHAAQQKQGPVVGALLGQHNGREITLEHIFECVVVPGPNDEAQLPNDWFVERVKQCRSRENHQSLPGHEGGLGSGTNTGK